MSANMTPFFPIMCLSVFKIKKKQVFNQPTADSSENPGQFKVNQLMASFCSCFGGLL